MRFSKHWLFLFCAVCLQAHGQNSSALPQTVSFASGDEVFNGYLWVPDGEGPFRAIVWSYGKPQRLMKQGPASQFDALAKFYLKNRYVLFIPDRSRNDDGKTSEKNVSKKFADASASANQDLIAALTWLRQQTFVDATKIAVSGTLNGALHALLAAERDATIRAAVVFSPGSVSWDKNGELRVLLKRAVENTEVPTFLIQPQNDVSLKPTETLGPVISRKGGANRTRIYPPFAGDPRTFATDGCETWGKDVILFLDTAMK